LECFCDPFGSDIRHEITGFVDEIDPQDFNYGGAITGLDKSTDLMDDDDG